MANEDGFTLVGKKGSKGKNVAKQAGSKNEGFKMNRPKTNYYYRQVNKPKQDGKDGNKETKEVEVRNSFDILSTEDTAEPERPSQDNSNHKPSTSAIRQEGGSDVDEVESLVDETGAYMETTQTTNSQNLKGASTPVEDVFHV